MPANASSAKGMRSCVYGDGRCEMPAYKNQLCRDHHEWHQADDEEEEDSR